VNETTLLAAFGIGLAGAGHCLGMCGGIAAALNLGGKASATTTFSYHLGRLTSYTLLGASIGALAGVVDIAAWTIALRYLAGILLIGMGLSITGWWRGMSRLESVGSKLWQPVQRFSSRWLPIRHPHQGFALGLCWGLMPCGLIYSSLAWAGTAADPLRSGLLMLCFGLGTLPAMLATSFSAAGVRAFLQRKDLKILIGVLLIAAGIWTLYLVISHGAPTGGQGGHHH
jgi:sulfite exporter TauE/SafE